jgi:hypothetical protein
MATGAHKVGGQGGYWRIIGWGTAVLVLLLPLITNAPWTLSDYIFMGALFAIVGGLFELTVRVSQNLSYRAGVALALLGILLVIWVNLAVGIVGSESNPANLSFFGALLAGAVGAAFARFRANGLSAAMILTAVALGIAFAIAVAGPTDEPHVPHLRELAGTGVLAALFLGSALLFRRAARRDKAKTAQHQSRERPSLDPGRINRTA